jgi:hypothetical protein
VCNVRIDVSGRREKCGAAISSVANWFEVNEENFLQTGSD